MKLFDAHVHIADFAEIEKVLQTTIYKNKYRLYSSISLNAIGKTEDYLKQINGFYAMPFVTKETDIVLANKYTEEFSRNLGKAIFVPLIEDGEHVIPKKNSGIFKEHFLVHNYMEWKKRSKYYSFLNDNEYYLIIHCKDKIRIEYIEKLRRNFPHMNIVIPHMGRDVYENYEFSKKVLDSFIRDEHISFDTSTITNPNILKYAIKKVGFDRISFGSDYPLGFSGVPTLNDLLTLFNEIKINEDNFNKIVYNNALNRILDKS